MRSPSPPSTPSLSLPVKSQREECVRASAAHARALHSRWLKFIACELRGRLGSKQCSPCSLLTAVGGRSSHWNLGPPRKCHGCAGPPKARAAPPLSRGQERRQILGRLRRPLRSRDRIACPAAQSARTLAGSRARAGELEGAASRSPGPAPAVAVREPGETGRAGRCNGRHNGRGALAVSKLVQWSSPCSLVIHLKKEIRL